MAMTAFSPLGFSWKKYIDSKFSCCMRSNTRLFIVMLHPFRVCERCLMVCCPSIGHHTTGGLVVLFVVICQSLCLADHHNQSLAETIAPASLPLQSLLATNRRDDILPGRSNGPSSRYDYQ